MKRELLKTSQIDNASEKPREKRASVIALLEKRSTHLMLFFHVAFHSDYRSDLFLTTLFSSLSILLEFIMQNKSFNVEDILRNGESIYLLHLHFQHFSILFQHQKIC